MKNPFSASRRSRRANRWAVVPGSTRPRTAAVNLQSMSKKLAAAGVVIFLAGVTSAAASVSLFGRVTGPAGAPVAGAQVVLVPALGADLRARMLWDGKGADTATAARSMSDPTGAFRLEAPGPGMWSVRIAAAGYVTVESTPAPVFEDTSLPEAALARDLRLDVTVTAGGTPRKGALVRVETLPGVRLVSPYWRPAVLYAWTGDDGAAHVSRGADELRVTVAARDGLVWQRAGVRAATLAVALEAGVRQALAATTAAGRPAARALVLDAATGVAVAETGADGRAAVPLRAGAKTALTVVGEGGARGATTAGPALEADTVLRVALAPATAITGRVLDAQTRRAVQGALVWLRGSTDPPAVSDGTGQFTVTTPARARLALTAAAAGYLEEVLTGVRPRARPAAIALRPAARLEGKVVDAAGKPVAAATLRLVPPLPEPGRGPRRGMRPPPFGPEARLGGNAETRSRSDGTFRFAAVDPAESWDLSVSAHGFASLTRELGQLEPRRTRSNVVVTLARAASIVGSVADADGAPLAGAEVAAVRAGRDPRAMLRALFLGGANDVPVATTGENGTFELGDVGAGTWDVSVRLAGFARTTLPGREVGATGAPLDVGRIVLPRGATLAGRVVDGQGAPVDAAGIAIVESNPLAALAARRGPDDLTPDTVTGADGGFAIDDRRTGERVDVVAVKDGYVTARLAGVTVPPEEPLALVIHATTRATGRVIDGAKRPVAHAVVSARSAARGGPGFGGFGGPGGPPGMFGRRTPNATETDDDGRFVLDGLEPGRFTLRVTADGFEQEDLAGLEAVEGRTLDDLLVVLQAGASVEGRVLGPDGAAVIGARVSLAGDEGGPGNFGGTASATTDGDGYYRLDNLAAGAVSVQATCESYPRAVRDAQLTAGANHVDLQFTGGQDVSGFVRDDTGAAVTRADVRLATGDRPFGGYTAQSGDDGAFRIAGIVDGDYQLTATRSGYSAATPVAVKVAGQPVAGLALVLKQGGAIYGSVTGLDPADVPRVQIVASSAGSGGGPGGGPGPGGTFAQPDAQGNFRIEHLAAGDWTLVATLPDTGRRARNTATVPADPADVRLDLAFPPGYTLSGHVVLDGDPVQDAFLNVVPADSSKNGGSARSAYDGSFRIEGLEAGVYTVRMNDVSRGLSHAERLTLDGDRDITIRVPVMKVTGRVLDAADRAPVQGATLSLASADGSTTGFGPPRPGVTTDRDGAFTIDNVTAGTWRVSARKTGYAVRETSVVVADGADANGVELLVDATEGLTLVVRLASGAFVDEVQAVILDAAGRSVTGGRFASGENGRVRLSSVPAGAWTLLVDAEGSATARLAVTAPGPALPLTLPPSCTLDVRVVPLADGTTPATLSIYGPDGRAYSVLRGFGGAVSAWPFDHGRAHVTGLPPGTWSLVVATGGGQTYRGSATTDPSIAAQVTLP